MSPFAAQSSRVGANGTKALVIGIGCEFSAPFAQDLFLEATRAGRDIQPPDLETKVAILKKKAEAEAVPLPDDVALYIAGKIKSNVRELEGSLIRLIAYASLTGSEISLTLAQEVLRDLLDSDDQNVTIEMVQKFVANYYKLKIADLKSRNNAQTVTLPRQIAMYLVKSLTTYSLPQIGKSFGGKHHSTVIHSIKKIDERCKRDRDFQTLINSFLQSFR